MTTILVVPAAELEKQGRQLAHAISQVDGQKAAMWTAAHYLNNEPQISGSQPVIFLGPTQPAQDLAEVMPVGFEAKGVSCHVEGHRAVILATLPETQDPQELRAFQGELEGATRAVLDKAAHDVAKPTVAAGAAAALAVMLPLTPTMIVALGLPAAAVWYKRLKDLKAARRRVTQAQYRYGIALFTADHLDSFLAQ